MANTRLETIDKEIVRPQKSGSVITSASMNFAVTYASPTFSGNSTIDLGNSPRLAGMLAVTLGSGTVITMQVQVSVDGTNYGESPNVDTPTSGSHPVYPDTLAFTAANWTIQTSTYYFPFSMDVTGFRYAKIRLKSDSATGSVLVYLAAGTN